MGRKRKVRGSGRGDCLETIARLSGEWFWEQRAEESLKDYTNRMMQNLEDMALAGSCTEPRWHPAHPVRFDHEGRGSRVAERVSFKSNRVGIQWDRIIVIEETSDVPDSVEA